MKMQSCGIRYSSKFVSRGLPYPPLRISTAQQKSTKTQCSIPFRNIKEEYNASFHKRYGCIVVVMSNNNLHIMHIFFILFPTSQNMSN